MAKLTGIKAVLADKSRLAKWKANPGLRSKLPEQYLTPEQRLARRMGQEIFPGAGITGFEQARQAKSATDQVYGPQKLALQEQQNVLGAQRQRNAGWWDQYVGQLRAMQAPQANTIAGPDVGAQYGAPAGAATQGVQQAAGGYQQALSSLASGMLANNVAVGGQRKLESLAGLDAQELGVVQKKGALQREADLFKQDQKDKIKSSLWQQALEAAAFKLKTTDTLADNKRAAAKDKADANKPPTTDTQLAPDQTHTMSEWLKASPAQKAAWMKQARDSGLVSKPKGSKPKEPKAGEPGSPQRKAAWDTAMAALGGKKTPWLDGKGRVVYLLNGKAVYPDKDGKVPSGATKRVRSITPAYAKTHREGLVRGLILEKKIPRDIAVRAVDRFIAGSSKTLGSGRG